MDDVTTFVTMIIQVKLASTIGIAKNHREARAEIKSISNEVERIANIFMQFFITWHGFNGD